MVFLGGGSNKGNMDMDKKRHTRDGVHDKVPHAVVVQVLHEVKVLRHDVVDGAGRVVGRLPKALAHVVDADPHGDEQVVGGPRGVRGRGHEVGLEVGDLRNDVGRDARVDERVGHVGAVVGKVVGQDGRGVVLARDEADPLCVCV